CWCVCLPGTPRLFRCPRPYGDTWMGCRGCGGSGKCIAGGREAPVAAGSTPCPPVVDDGGLFQPAKVGLQEIERQPRPRVLNQIPHAQPLLAAMVAAGPDGLNLMVDIP